MEDSAFIVWGEDDDDDASMDVDAGDDDRLFTYEVAKRNEQEESASSRAGFQVLTPTLSDTKSTVDSDFTKDEFMPHFELRGSCRLSRESIDLSSLVFMVKLLKDSGQPPLSRKQLEVVLLSNTTSRVPRCHA